MSGQKKVMPGHEASRVFVTKIPSGVQEQLRLLLEAQGFSFSYPIHTFFCAVSEGVACTLYTTLTLSVQGKKKEDFLASILEPLLQSYVSEHHEEEDTSPRIGVDESGKGDYFGPLCIAGVFADAQTIPILRQLGVRDSKELRDTSIAQIAPRIVASLPNYIIRLMPQQYNERYAYWKNLNLLLAWGHTTIIKTLSLHTHPQRAVIDQFAHQSVVTAMALRQHVDVPIEQRIRGEQDLVVAAASIVARWAFIQGLQLLEETYHCLLPKGVSPNVIAAAQRLVATQGKEMLPHVAKIHFSLTQRLHTG